MILVISLFAMHCRLKIVWIDALVDLCILRLSLDVGFSYYLRLGWIDWFGPHLYIDDSTLMPELSLCAELIT